MKRVVFGLVLLVTVASCGIAKPPVITPEDQVQVRAVATKGLSGIEVVGVVVRDARQMVSDLAASGVVTLEVRSAVNAAVIRANDMVQPAITEIAEATRIVTVQGLVRQVGTAFNALASLLEGHADARLQTAGRFIRTAVAAVLASVGVAS